MGVVSPALSPSKEGQTNEKNQDYADNYCNGSGATHVAVAKCSEADGIEPKVEMEAPGVGRTCRARRHQEEPDQERIDPDEGGGGSSNGSSSGIPGLWEYVPDNAMAAATASETYRKQEATTAVGSCLVTSSVRKDGKVTIPALAFRIQSSFQDTYCRRLHLFTPTTYESKVLAHMGSSINVDSDRPISTTIAMVKSFILHTFLFL